MSLSRRFASSLACLALSACALAGSARAERWTLSAGAGGTTGYGMSGSNQGFYPAWTVTADVARRLGDRWELRASAGDLHFSRPSPLVSVPEVRLKANRTVDFMPIGLGLRILSPERAGRPTRAYAEAIPSLFVSRWREHETWESMLGPPWSGSSDVRTTRVLAGFEAGAGFVWSAGNHLRPGLVVRYFVSGAPGTVAPLGTWQGGLSTVAVAASLGWAP